MRSGRCSRAQPLADRSDLRRYSLRPWVFSANFEYAFDRVWNVDQPKASGLFGGLKQILWIRLKAFLMLLGVGGLVLAGFLAGLLLSGASTMSDNLLGLPTRFWDFVQFTITLAFNGGMFTLIYRVLPKVPVRWSDAARGGRIGVDRLGNRPSSAGSVCDRKQV